MFDTDDIPPEVNPDENTAEEQQARTQPPRQNDALHTRPSACLSRSP